MMQIEVSGDMEDALRRLKKVVALDGILIELKMRSIGHKHSDFIKMKKARAERRRLKRDGKRRVV